MNIDLFKNYDLQREELLTRIAFELELDKTRREKMETAYNAISELLKNDDEFFKELEIVIYPQGSVMIGTTVKPINRDDFDLDTVLHIYDPHGNHTPEEIYNALVAALERSEVYESKMKKKNRCVRIDYKDDFHIDILPGCMVYIHDREKIAIPEKGLIRWTFSNPKGYGNWFLNIASMVKESMLSNFRTAMIEAKVETEPLPDDFYNKSPLQRAVQLVKRYRDIFFENKDYAVSSIVISTLLARMYEGEGSTFETIDNAIGRIISDYDLAVRSGKKFKIFNPVDTDEEFTDSWIDKHYESFYAFVTDFSQKWSNLKNSFETSKEDYIKLFGEGVYKQCLIGQEKCYAGLTEDKLSKASGLILGGKAHTDKHGQINSENGVKNQKHHNYGG